LFLYKEVLDKPLGDVDALRAKRTFHERVSPSRDQVRQLRGAVENTQNTPACLIVDLLYGCGMRVGLSDGATFLVAGDYEKSTETPLR
jgi:hypothetical protein